MVRFGEGSRLLVTGEAGWGLFAAPAHRIGQRCRLSSGTVTLALPQCDGEGHPQSYHITPPFALAGCLVLAPA